MTISAHEAEVLKSEGFTELEVMAFAEALDPKGNPQPPIDIHSPFWIHLREQRTALQEELVRIAEAEGWPEGMMDREQRDNIIDGFYGAGRRYKDPWEWLKQEYKPRQKKDLII